MKDDTTLVIGDVHGCLDTLKELLKDVDLSSTRVILVGDLIDRGPDSEGVVDFVRTNSIETVIGNHEVMAIQDSPELANAPLSPYTTPSDIRIKLTNWYRNGGDSCIRHYSSTAKLLSDVEWFKTLPVAINTEIMYDNLPVIVSHTDITGHVADPLSVCRPYTPSDESLVWTRSTRPRRQLYFNIFGHTPVDYWKQGKYTSRHTAPPTAEYKRNTLNLDTGCCYPTTHRGYLTGVFLPSFEIIQVKR